MKYKKSKDKGFLTELMQRPITQTPVMRPLYETIPTVALANEMTYKTNDVSTFLDNFLNNKTTIWNFDQECFVNMKPLNKKGIAGSAYEKDGRIVKKFHAKLNYKSENDIKYNKCEENKCAPNLALYEYLTATILSQQNSDDVFENPNPFLKVYSVGICNDEFYIEMEKVNGIRLSDYEEKNIHEYVNIIIKLLKGMADAYEKYNFVHNDFHFNNIMLEEKQHGTDYIYHNGTKYELFSSGYNPKVIDYSQSSLNYNGIEFQSEKFKKIKKLNDHLAEHYNDMKMLMTKLWFTLNWWKKENKVNNLKKKVDSIINNYEYEENNLNIEVDNLQDFISKIPPNLSASELLELFLNKYGKEVPYTMPELMELEKIPYIGFKSWSKNPNIRIIQEKMAQKHKNNIQRQKEKYVNLDEKPKWFFNLF